MTPNKTFSIVALSLLASVLLNLFLVGGTLSLCSFRKPKPFAPFALEAPHGDYFVGWMTRALDPADAEAFKQAFQTHAEAFKNARKDVHKAMDDVSIVFQLEKPDQAALDETFQKLSEARKNMHTVLNAILSDIYPKMTPEGRQRLATLIEEKI